MELRQFIRVEDIDKSRSTEHGGREHLRRIPVEPDQFTGLEKEEVPLALLGWRVADAMHFAFIDYHHITGEERQHFLFDEENARSPLAQADFQAIMGMQQLRRAPVGLMVRLEMIGKSGAKRAAMRSTTRLYD